MPHLRKTFFLVVFGITMLGLLSACGGGFAPGPMQTTLGSNGTSGTLTPEQKAFETFLKNDCHSCHGTRPGNGNVYLYDTNELVTAGWIVPGDATNSSVYQNTGGGHHGRVMSAADRLVIQQWITSLAPAPTPTPTPTPGPTPLPNPNPNPNPTPTPTPTPAMTKAQAFTATTGPNGSSVNTLLSTNRCANCHYSGGATPNNAAMNYIVLSPLDAAGNLSRLKAVTIGGTTYDLTLKTSSPNLMQFVTGHKAKNPAYSAAEVTHIQNWVNMP